MIAKVWGLVLVAVAVAAGGAVAGERPQLPFEKLAAVKLDGRSILHFDDFAGKIGDARIKRLLRSGDILGDRVLLQNEVAVYFPDGHIVSSKAEFHSHRPLGGLFPWNVYSASQIEPNPRYEHRAEFEALLGPVCSESTYLKGSARGGGESFARLRINPQGVLSLELDTPGRYDGLTGMDTRSYTVVSAIDPYYLGEPMLVQQLMNGCSGGQRSAIEQAKASNR